MPQLADEIDLLADLDVLRVRSARLRDQGLLAIEGYTSIDWIEAKDPVEQALLCRVLCHSKAVPSLLPKVVDDLEKMALRDVFSIRSDNVPILRAARCMQALVGAPDSAFSEATVYCYYRVLRELYSPDPPHWIIGAARAGEEGPASAFATSECARAILSLERNLRRTATFLRGVKNLVSERNLVSKSPSLDQWNQLESERLKLSFFITLKQFSGNIALRLPLPAKDISLDDLTDFINRIEDLLPSAIKTAIETLEKSHERIKLFRDEERKVDQANHARTTQGHDIAIAAIRGALETAQEARQILCEKTQLVTRLEEIAVLFKRKAQETVAILTPSRRYFGSVIDRELARASSGVHLLWDPNELAFAAASYGTLTGNWDDDRLIRAADFLSENLSVRGRFQVGRAFMTNSKGYALHVVGAEVIRSFSQIMHKVTQAPLSPSLARSLLAFFEDTRVSIPTLPLACGWSITKDPRPQRPILWITALSTLALAEVNQMLDNRINERVFAHFSVQRFDTGQAESPEIGQLFFPDYGLTLAPKKICRKEPLAISLEKMRSHVVGVNLSHRDQSRTYSMVLHGPPGTGKTTLVEALAATCGCPLIEVTPSDIAIGGAEAIERQSRAVFRALSMVTGAVILFDEFEPVLRRRDRAEPPSLFSFLTPGMLPKLKNLNKQARRRRVAYILITNFIGDLDNAAIRSGRFDIKKGVFPADPLSRSGRLISQLRKFYHENGIDEATVDTQEIRRRILIIVQSTRGTSMQKLAQSSWYTRPQSPDAIEPGSAFELLLRSCEDCGEGNHTDTYVPPTPDLTSLGIQGSGPDALLEYQQWAWIEEWDSRFSNSKILTDALIDFPHTVDRPASKRRRSNLKR